MLYAYTGEMVYFHDAFWHLIVNLCLFYTTAHVFLPYENRISGNIRRISIGIGLIIIALIFYTLLKYLLAIGYDIFTIETTRPYLDFQSFFRDTTWRFINISGLAFGYWFAINFMEKQRELAHIEHERLEDQLLRESAKNDFMVMENDLLKSKINFHFLFNTLNFIHDSVKDLDKNASDALMSISDILRYSLGTPSNGKIKLKEELKYANALFKINNLKSNGQKEIAFSITGRAGNLEIIPLVLVTLCENIMKYAELSDEAAPAYFKCQINEETLTIDIGNKKRKSTSPISYGIGMKNTEKRLQLAYPNRHHLTVAQNTEQYKLHLIIQLS